MGTDIAAVDCVCVLYQNTGVCIYKDYHKDLWHKKVCQTNAMEMYLVFFNQYIAQRA